MNIPTPEEVASTIAAMEAARNGAKLIEFRSRWNPPANWDKIRTKDVSWALLDYNYRPLPEVRGWNKASDVPGPVCWLRNTSAPTRFILVSGMGEDGVCANSKGLNWSTLRMHFEYSLTRAEGSWKPCTVSEP